MGKFFGLREIRAILPQRYPMLMLDRAEQVSDTKFVGLKNLSINENFFQGHFPGHAIMPGVLQLEAMKQLGELAVRPQLDPAGEFDVYMRVVEKVKFRRPNNPGDRVKVEAEILSVENGEAVVKAQTSNNGGLTCEAKITLAIRPKNGPTAMPELHNEFDKCDATPMDVEKIKSLIPHRYPFLFIDYIARIEGDHVFAVKNLTGNEEIFSQAGDYAVMPESLLCEITAEELEHACRKSMTLFLDKGDGVDRALRSLGIAEYNMLTPTSVEIFAEPTVSALAFALREAGIELLRVSEKDVDLEGYFMGLIGGAQA